MIIDTLDGPIKVTTNTIKSSGPTDKAAAIKALKGDGIVEGV